MIVQVKLFAILREQLGTSQMQIDLPDGTTAADCRRILAERFPKAAVSLTRTALAINLAYASPDQRLSEGDEVALIPPVSGG